MAARAKVMVAMSGGVDSSVAASLLCEQGYSVVGVTMCLGVAPSATAKATCCGTQAIADARKVADRLGIPHYVFDFSSHLADKVIEPFVAHYRAGRTPNPCVLCNRHLKFSSLLTKAKGMGFDFLATGHYAALRQTPDGPGLFRGGDTRKDQTYFLYPIPRHELDRILFPLSQISKQEVRKAARTAGLGTADKPGSQDICFIPNGNYREFVASRAGESPPGAFVTTGGTIVGEHRGILHYTIGQRKGLGIAAGVPRYVIAIDPAANQVVLGDERQLYARGLTAVDVNLLVSRLPTHALAQIRYNHPPVPCTVRQTGTGFSLTFTTPEKSVTPGQSVVLYEGDRVLGGGVIDASLP